MFIALFLRSVFPGDVLCYFNKMWIPFHSYVDIYILIGPNDYIDTLMTYKKIYNYQNANVWNVHVNTV